jgi:hypothetical protein
MSPCDHNGIPLIKGMMAAYPFQLASLPGSQNARIFLPFDLCNFRKEFFGCNQLLAIYLCKNILEVRVHRDGHISRYRPGCGGPDEDICILINIKNPFAVPDREKHIDRFAFILLVLHLCFS